MKYNSTTSHQFKFITYSVTLFLLIFLSSCASQDPFQHERISLKKDLNSQSKNQNISEFLESSKKLDHCLHNTEGSNQGKCYTDNGYKCQQDRNKSNVQICHWSGIKK